MTPKKPAHDILPECASIMATLVEQMKEVTKDQLRIADTIYGDGKPGLREQTEANIRDIASSAAMIREMIEVRKLETQARTEETKVRLAETQQRAVETRARKSDTRKWWLGIAAVLIAAIIAIAQNVATAAALARLAGTQVP